MKATLATVCLLAGSVSLAQAQFSGRPQFGPNTNDPFQRTQEQYRIPTHVAPPNPFPKGHPLGLRERDGETIDPVQELLRQPPVVIRPPSQREFPRTEPAATAVPPVSSRVSPFGTSAIKGAIAAVVASLVSIGATLFRRFGSEEPSSKRDQ